MSYSYVPYRQKFSRLIIFTNGKRFAKYAEKTLWYNYLINLFKQWRRAGACIRGKLEENIPANLLNILFLYSPMNCLLFSHAIQLFSWILWKFSIKRQQELKTISAQLKGIANVGYTEASGKIWYNLAKIDHQRMTGLGGKNSQLQLMNIRLDE